MTTMRDLFDALFLRPRVPGRGRRADWPFVWLTVATATILLAHCATDTRAGDDHLPQVKPAASATGESRHAAPTPRSDAADATTRTPLVNPTPAARGDAAPTSRAARRQGGNSGAFVCWRAGAPVVTPARDMDGKSTAAGLRHHAHTMSASPRRHGGAARGLPLAA